MAFISTQKVGGLRFVRIGRLCLSFCIARKHAEPRRAPARKRALKLPRANWTPVHVPSPTLLDSQLLAIESAIGEAEAILAEYA